MTYRIGSAQGYYGDDVLHALPMIRGGHVDVVCFEALAELTLAILQKDRLKDPSRGYTFDIGIIAGQILPEAYRRGIPLITSGGGLNPRGAAELVQSIAVKQGLSGVKIAYVTGDDMLPRLSELAERGHTFKHLETDTVLDVSADTITNANVYLGAKPIVDALNAGADIVITGRVADPALYLAPLIAHYGWAWDDWDRLASGIVAGHLLECTAQVVGGNSLGVIDDIDAAELNKLGYPIAHVEADGTFTLTKTPDMPGIVNARTVKEQLLYEVHDPANYITPDVVADFTTLTLTQVDENQVTVRGVTGKAAPEQYKLNIGMIEGYARELIFTLGYPETRRKYTQLQTMIRETFDGLAIDRLDFQLMGQNSLFGDMVPLDDDPLEMAVRVMFTAADESTLKTAVRRMMTNGLSGPAGMSVSGTTISASPRIIVGLFPTLLPREIVQPEVHFIEVTT